VSTAAANALQTQPAFVITALGAVVFAPFKMEWKNREQKPTKYNRFWYRLDEFTAVIDLGEAKNWSAMERCRWTRYYARFHRIAGWVLVPLILGAITGIVK
jgi:hypothetical protein